MLAGGGEVLLRLITVHYVPSGLQIVGTPILIEQVVGMFPDIDSDDRFWAFHNRAILVSGGSDLEVPFINHQPRPTAAESAGAGGLELFLERIKATESRINGVSQVPFRSTARVWADNFPKEGMVRVPARIVPNHGANRLGNLIEIGTKLIDRLGG